MTEIARALGVTIVGYLLMAVESPLLQHLHLSYFAPDLALLAAIWAALHLPFVSGILTCLALGYLKDGFVMATPVGMHMEIFAVLFLVVRSITAHLVLRSTAALVVLSAIASVLASLLFALLSLLFDTHFHAFGLVLRMMLPLALVTAPFAPGIFFLLDRTDRLFHRRSRTTFGPL